MRNSCFAYLRYLLALCAWALVQADLLAQVRVEQSETELAFWLPDKQEPAIVFPLEENWLEVGYGWLKVHEHFGSFKLRAPLHDRYRHVSLTSITQDLSGAAIVSGKLRRGRASLPFEIKATSDEADQLHLSIHLEKQPAQAQLILRYLQNSTAHVFGAGEQYSHLNLQGHKVPVIPEENGLGRGDPKITPLTRLAGVAGNEFSTYCPIPFYMTTEGKGVLVREGSPWYLDFSRENRVEIHALDGYLEMDIWQKKQPLDILEAFSKVNGRFPILPDWAWGTWLGIQGGAQRVDAIVQRMKAAGCPVDAVWIQDWVGKRQTKFGSRLQWHWEQDQVRYPRLKEWIATKNAQGIKVLGYINPFLKSESPWVDSLARFFLHDTHGRPLDKIPVGGFDAYQFELHEPETRAMLVEMIRKNLIDLGFSGWMADFAEWYGRRARFESEVRGSWIAAHNDYPIWWQQVNRMAIEGTGHPEDYVFFSRSGYLGAARHAMAYWAGDQMTSWGKQDGLPSAVVAMISSGMSGIAINHSDIGGYTSVSNACLKVERDAVLLQRWAEFAAFTPIFRTHEGLMPDGVQVWGTEQVHQGFVKMAQVHAALRDYLKALNIEAHEQGWPMVRHLWLQYPEDPEALDIALEYLLGSDILVMPNVSPTDDKVHGYFPKGEWVHLITPDTRITGPRWADIAAPLGTPAVFMRSDSKWIATVLPEIGKAFHLK